MSTLPREGDRLGRFQIERRLGKGGMGIVYLALDTTLDTKVVLKLLLPYLTEGGDIDRFKRELLVARRISHPGVCRLFDIHEEDDFHFISMEHIQGRTLQEIIRDEAPLPAERAIRLMLAACDGIAAAHDIGIIHRDLKPGNIMVTDDDKVSILDFGLSKALDLASITVTNVRVGTVQYMSPEVVQNKDANKQSDIYSLGVVLYECMTRHLPFKGYDMVTIGKAAAAGKWVPPRLINPEIPPAVEELISRTLEPNLEKRFKSIGEVRKALNSVLTEIAPEKPEVGKKYEDVRESKIEDSVIEVFGNPTYSEVLRARVKNTTILFSDIVAITEYFEKFGDISGTKRIQIHNELLFPVIKKYRGEVIKTVGDAIMACFDTAEDGVGAAIGMQRALEKHNESVESSDEKISVRIGINSGESIFQSRDVFGDVVNVAARICSEAKGSHILISAATRDTLHPERHPTTFHSKVSLKGKSIPQKLFSIHWGPQFLEEGEPTAAKIPKLKALLKPFGIDLSRRQLIAIAGGAAAAIIAVIITVAISAGGNDIEPAVTTAPPAPAPLAPDTVEDPAPEVDPLLDETASDLDPTPIPSEKDETDESTADLSEPSKRQAFDAYVQKYRALRTSIRVAMRKKGIITGDNHRLDKERRKMKSHWKKTKYAEALRAGRRAKKLLRDIRVDKTLVKAKLLRFNRLYDRIGDKAKKKKITPLAGEIMEAYDSGRYRDANKLLNRAIRMM